MDTNNNSDNGHSASSNNKNHVRESANAGEVGGGSSPEDLRYRYQPGRIPEDDAFLVSHLLFFWARPLFQRAAYLQKEGLGLQHDDLLPLPARDHAQAVTPLFERAWAKAEVDETATSSTNGAGAASEPRRAQKLEDLQSKDAQYITTRTRMAIRSVLGRRFVVAGFIKLFNTCLQFTFPLLLNAILRFIEDTQEGKFTDDDPWHEQYRGYWLSVVLFVAMASKAVTENTYFHFVYRCGFQTRVAISTAVYAKALRLANAERQSTTLGELINLMQVDATKIEMFIPQIHVLWDGAVQITGYMTILYTLIGWPCFAGLAIMMAAGPIQASIMRRLFGLNRQMVTFTDTRVKTTNEALQGIQSVKMYTWEDSFAKQIGAARNQELNFMKTIAYLRGASRAYMSALPGVVAVGSFIVYALTHDSVRASTLFAALVAFEQLRFPLLFYPMSLAQLAQAKVSAARLEVYLAMKEIDRGEHHGGGTYTRNDKNPTGEIKIQDAVVYWSDPEIPIDVSQHSNVSGTVTGSSDLESGKRFPKPILKNVSLEVSNGQLCAVVGPVASGKSTLCAAVLNESLLDRGSITLNGSVAYVAQTAWILNATLRDNILFGLPYDEEKYNSVIKACQLTHDLAMLEDGDKTEIGERGINLSGGQKQRVSVARAAYSNAQTIILDDPLSALDPEVARKLFEECIVNFMKDRTRLLITNQIQFLRHCDTVVALRDGEVVEKGTFNELMAKEDGEVQRLIAEAEAGGKDNDSKKESEKGDKKQQSDGGKEAATAMQAKKKDAKALVSQEERNVGAVSLSVYLNYVKAGGGWIIFTGVVCGALLTSLNQLAVSSWVSYWTSDTQYERHSEAFYLGFYFAFAVLLGFLTFLRVLMLARFGIFAANTLHGNLLQSILRAPQSFFDTTPIGRIISRFSKDLYSIDIELVENLDFFISFSISALVSIATIMFVTPWFGLSIPPLALFYFHVLNYFRSVSRETKRLESISRSPVYAHFSEALGGLTTIRAYGQPSRFMDEFEEKVDQNTRAFYCNKAADRWLSVRLECVGAVVAGLAAVFAANVAISGAASGQSSDSNFSSLAGLSLSFAISLTGLMNWCVRSFAQLEASMNSCERVLHYSENIPQEAPFTSSELKERASSWHGKPPPSDPSVYAVIASGGEVIQVEETWPETGTIVLNQLKMRYRTDTPLVLKGLNVTIPGGERVGVVGRTGSGKSSLLLTLLRLVEPALMDDRNNDDYDENNKNDDSYKAPVTIDGVDILRIGLKELRSRLGIIPQNPVLFSGTIRSNIDPFVSYSDDQIWAALEQCGLRNAVLEMPGGLSAAVAEYGENLSAGMRQMLVLGRALLRQCRVLLLDEATSSVDFETDRAIQRTIRECFPGCTVITIAHRINTIMDSDKILVMKDGIAEEFASPSDLLKNEDSIFSEIVRQSQTGDH